MKRARQSIKIDFSISTWLITIENTRDTISQGAIYLFLNGVNPYNSIINIFKKPSLLEDFGHFCVHVCYSSFHDNVCVCSRQWLAYGHPYAKRQPLAYGQRD